MQKISVCTVCESIITRSMPRCPVCGAKTKVQVLEDTFPDDGEDSAVDPFDSVEELRSMLFDAWDQIEKLNGDVEHYKEEEAKDKEVLKKKLDKINAQEDQIKELTSRISDLETEGEQDSATKQPEEKKGLFGKSK